MRSIASGVWSDTMGSLNQIDKIDFQPDKSEVWHKTHKTCEDSQVRLSHAQLTALLARVNYQLACQPTS